MTLEVEQAVRVSHCAHPDRNHACVGTCKITPAGIELECTLCGRGEEGSRCDVDRYSNIPLVSAAREVLRAAGVNWDCLNIDTQLAVIKALRSRLEAKT